RRLIQANQRLGGQKVARIPPARRDLPARGLGRGGGQSGRVGGRSAGRRSARRRVVGRVAFPIFCRNRMVSILRNLLRFVGCIEETAISDGCPRREKDEQSSQ